MSSALLREGHPRAVPSAAPEVPPAVPPAPAALDGHAWYPLVVALWLVVRMASANVADLVGPSDLVRPLALALAGAAVAMGIAWALVRDADRRGVVALILVLWYALFGSLRDSIDDSPVLSAMLPDRSPLLATGILVVILAAAVVRLRLGRPGLTRFLNVASVALLVLPLPGLVRGLWRERKPPELAWPLPPVPAAAPARAAGSERPDVYLIILDKYTGARALRTHYAFDNEPFLRELEARGFVAPRGARSNYTLTHLSLSSMLNWAYLPGSPADSTEVEDALPVSYAHIETNRTAEAMKRAGYRYVFMPGGYAATARSRRADQTLDIGQPRWTEFERIWWSGSMLAPLELQVCRGFRDFCRWLRRRQSLDSPVSIAGGFDLVSGVARDSTPKFVFAHFTVPHDPYVFEADCSHRVVGLRIKGWPHPETGERERVMKKAYTAQIQCVNRLVLAMVDSIDAHSKVRPVILLQSDHGNGRIGGAFLPKDSLSADRIAERFTVFAAYRFPGAEQVVHDSIGPVNAIPAMLNAVIGTSIPAQPERRFWATWHAPFRLVPVE